MTADNIYQAITSAQKLHQDVKIFTNLENNDFFEYPFEFSLENKDLIIYSDQAWVQYNLDVIIKIESW